MMDALTDAEKVEMGLSMAKGMRRTADSELRVLIFTATYFVLDGVTLTIRRIEGHMRSIGATVKICSTVPSDIPAEQIQNIIVVPGIKIPFADSGADYAFGVSLDENTIRQIEEFNPNCVHFTVPDFVAMDGIKWCQRNNIAYMGTWHSNYVDYLKYYFIEWILGPGFHRYLKGFYEQIPTVYIPTPYMLKRLADWGYGSSAQLKQWGRGIDMDLFSPQKRSQPLRLSKGFQEDAVVVLWVGRIVPEKRPDIWLHVVKRLQQEGIPVKAMVVGSGTYEKALSQLRDVACLGWLSGTAIAEAYASADILLFPSDVETFGNVTLEALSCGTPAIVETKCGSHLVDHGVNGYTCPSNDYEAFYQATKQIAIDPVLRGKMSKNARESAYRFERSKILQQMAENYKDAIDLHADPMFMKKRLQSSPEAAGKNLMNYLCCNYWLVKTFAEPFLNTASGVQNLVHGTSECVAHSRSRLNCTEHSYTALAEREQMESENSRFEDERKGRSVPNTTTSLLSRILYYAAMVASYIIIAFFIYAAFTI